MQTIALPCPHCGIEHMTTEIAGAREFHKNSSATKFDHAVVGFCRGCRGPIASLLRFDVIDLSHRGIVLQEVLKRQHIPAVFEILAIWPEPQRPNAPDFLPPDVERTFIQGERTRLSGDLDAAGTMYRKALEAGTKKIAPNLAGKPLASRLKAMEDQGMLTKEIAEWANRVRLLGNEATHDEEEPTVEGIEDLANLTRITLVYIFEMPERIRRMREVTDGKKSEPNY